MERTYTRNEMKELFKLTNRYCYNEEGIKDPFVKEKHLKELEQFLISHPGIAEKKYLSENRMVYNSMLELFPAALDRNLLHAYYEAGFNQTSSLLSNWLRYGKDDLGVLLEIEKQLKEKGKELKTEAVLSWSRYDKKEIMKYEIEKIKDDPEAMKRSYTSYIANTSKIQKEDLEIFRANGIDIRQCNGKPTINEYMKNPNANKDGYEVLKKEIGLNDIQLPENETILHTYMRENTNISTRLMAEIARDIDAGRQNDKGNNALMEYVQRDDYEYIRNDSKQMQIILEIMDINNVNMNTENKDGKTAAHLLAENPHTEDCHTVIQDLDLLVSELNFRKKDKKGKTAFDLLIDGVEEKSRDEIMRDKLENISLTDITELKMHGGIHYDSQKLITKIYDAKERTNIEQNEPVSKERKENVAKNLMQDGKTELRAITYLHSYGVEANALMKNYIDSHEEKSINKNDKIIVFLANSNCKMDAELAEKCEAKGVYIKEHISAARELSEETIADIKIRMNNEQIEEHFIQDEMQKGDT